MDDLGLPPVERNEATNFICQVALMSPRTWVQEGKKMKPWQLTYVEKGVRSWLYVYVNICIIICICKCVYMRVYAY